MHSTSYVLRLVIAVVVAILALHIVARVAGAALQEDELPEPQAVDFVSNDGVILAGNYFPSAAGKESPVAILLHALGRTQRDYDDFAFKLQDHGFAVLTFDFRGHGYSTRMETPYSPQAQAAGTRGVRLDWRSLRTPDALRTLRADIEASKRFLIEKHNAGELNIAKLVIVGAEVGASLGVEWAEFDWKRPVHGFSGRQGQDVQALVLLSPELNFRGIQIHDTIGAVGSRVRVMFAAGAKESAAAMEVERLHAIAGRAAPDGHHQLQLLDTRVQRSKLLAPTLGLQDTIIQFVQQSVGRAPRWTVREVSE